MSERAAERLTRPQLFTIPTHRSFADALVAGLIARFGDDPLRLASGRILLPNNRAARSLTDAFVRASGSGLLLPRLIPIGDPELEERVGGALDPADESEPIPAAIDPMARLFELAELVRREGETTSEALRLAADLGRTIDALLIEEVAPERLAEAAADAPDLAQHWQKAIERLRAVLELWPHRLDRLGRIDLADRRNRLLRRLADRWRERPPAGFTMAAGITTAAPAVAALLKRVCLLPEGMVVMPGLNRASTMPDTEWEVLGPDESGRGTETHPQFHLKLLLQRMGVAREEVKLWPRAGLAASTPARTRAIANAMAAAEFTHKWRPFMKGRPDGGLPAASRRLSGVRTADAADPAAEAQIIALALREALETPGRTAALVTPDRLLAERVAALLARWGIEADDSAGRPLGRTPAGSLLLAAAAVAAEDFAPVPLLALLKHPLVEGGEGKRLGWLESVRSLDLALRGPRPAGGLEGLDRQFASLDKDRRCRGCLSAWQKVRSRLGPLHRLAADPLSLRAFATRLSDAVQTLAPDQAWAGPDGRMAAELLAELQDASSGESLSIAAGDAVPVLRQLLDERRVRPPYGGHPRIFIWGLLEARLQQADLMVLGGLNEGVWPAAPTPDPWLAPKIRANLGMPGLEFRIGLAAHDFASALGAREVLITRARRDSRSPTVASRFWLRLHAMTGGLARDVRLERIAALIDDAGEPRPMGRPQPNPRREDRPREIWVTAVDRLKADPFAFYAQAILKLRSLDPVDADHTAAWKGSAVHKVLEEWLAQDDCDPHKLAARARDLLADETIHPMLRALWQPRLLEAIEWIADQERRNRDEDRRPLAAEASGSAEIGGVVVHGRADRIDRLADGGLAIIDYKTGAPPSQKTIDAGFALQLGLLGLIAAEGGFKQSGLPGALEYWSLTRNSRGGFGKLMRPDKEVGPEAFLEQAFAHFKDAAGRWLLGDEPFTAKLNPAYAPYGDYDQLMRLEEWYGRE